MQRGKRKRGNEKIRNRTWNEGTALLGGKSFNLRKSNIKKPPESSSRVKKASGKEERPKWLRISLKFPNDLIM